MVTVPLMQRKHWDMNQSIEHMYLSLLCKEQRFNLVAIYFHNDQTIIDTYLRYIQSCFDGVVIIDMSQDETVNCEIFGFGN